MLQVIYRPAAELELQEAYNGYEACRTGLGREFMGCIDDRIQIIRQFPHAFPAAHGDIRRAVVRRFPYSIFYLPETEAIIVLSVFHSSRKPVSWIRPE